MSLNSNMNDVAAEAAATLKITPRSNGQSRTGTIIEVDLPVDNRLGIPAEAYPMWVSGHSFATCAAVLQDIKCKLIVDCTPSVEGSEDEGPFDSIWPADDAPPEILRWSILSCHHKGHEMSRVMEEARKAWMAGGSILFYDNMGGRRCIVAVCVFLREAEARHTELWWLSTKLKPRRTLNSVLVELCDRYNKKLSWISNRITFRITSSLW